MSQGPNVTTSGDSPELEALFESIAGGSPASVAAAAIKPQAGAAVDMGSDSPELEQLFDQTVARQHAIVADGGTPGANVAFTRIGQMARLLHDALRELGYDKMLEQTVDAIPDAKDRLAYIANLTENAASRVLNATDIAMPLQDAIGDRSRALSERWEKLFANQMGVDEFKTLAGETRQFLRDELPGKAQATSSQLMEIMMAQDFQDLTGQVIKKIVVLAQELESQLLSVLLEIMPPSERDKAHVPTNLMNGPVINPEGRSDVVVNQGQVDDLLESLGF